MNKLVKGSIAGAAGIALLLGGAGTLALWNASAGLDAGSVTSGTLNITADGSTATFTDGTELTSSSLIVPGDVVTVVQDVNIDASGDNLRVELGVDASVLDSITGMNVTFAAKDAGGTTVAFNTSYMTAAEAELIESVTLEATFPSSVDGTDFQGLTLDLSEIAVTVKQVPKI